MAVSAWFKVDVGLLRSRKLKSLGKGHQGCLVVLVWLEILSFNMEHERDGVLQDRDIDPELIADNLGWWGATDESVRVVLDGLLQAGLLTKECPDRVRIADWDAWRPPKSDAERARNYRDRKRPGDSVTDLSRTRHGPVTDGVTAASEIVTPRAEQKQSRREQRRTAVPSEAPLAGTRTPASRLQEDPDPKAASATACPASMPATHPRVLMLDEALARIGYHRELAAKRTPTAVKLALAGVSREDLEALWVYAQTKGKNPIRLFAAWVNGERWRDALHEIERKERDRA